MMSQQQTASASRMGRANAARLLDRLAPVNAELDCWINGLLSRVRWITLAALVLLAFFEPLRGRDGLPTWLLILLFGLYNLLIELLHRRWPALRSYARISILDLPVAALLYRESATPGGVLFVLFLLIVTCAAASMSLRRSLLYTAAVVVVVALIAPNLPLWSSTTEGIRGLGARLIVIGLVGVSTAVLVRQVALERATASASRDEAGRLAELNRLRADFVASISHDLRTPLTATRAGLGMLETTATDRLRPDEQQLLSNVRRNTERLGILIDNLLAFNQLGAGVLRLDRAPLDLRGVVADALGAVHLLLREKQQALEIDLPAPLVIAGDARWLEQVLINLLVNAHQHTPPGTRVLISGRQMDGEVRLSVSDTGPGIAAAEYEAIFQDFYRLDKDGSSGLGLAIARRIVALHGGRIWVESAPGAGATFHIALPQAQAEEEV